MARRGHKPDYDGKTPLEDPRQELFCELFTTNTLPFYWGNGQNCYLSAYGHNKRLEKIEDLLTAPKKERGRKTIHELERAKFNILNICRSSASTLLTKPNIKARCGALLDQLAAHHIVDRELLYVIHQRRDLQSKVQAIRHHDQREARIREKLDLTHTFEPILGIDFVGMVKPKTK